MRVAIVAEFYPRDVDRVLGVWAHRQAIAARDAGAEVQVLVLHRPIPSRAAMQAGPRAAGSSLLALAREPLHHVRDGISITHVPFVSPPRPTSYGRWGAWASPSLAVALRRLHRGFPFDLIHAHNAVPAADAVRRSRIGVPLVTSVHGGDVFYTALRSRAGDRSVRRAFAASALVLANSSGIAERCQALSASAIEVLPLGTDLPETLPARAHPATLVTVAHLVARKRQGDVIRALWALRKEWPDLRYDIVGDGPERKALEGLAEELGVAGRVRFWGQLDHDEAMTQAWRATMMVMPSTDEAFGVAYIEAMAGSVPVIGAYGEPGPADIAAAGPGMLLVAPGDVEELARTIDRVLRDRRLRHELRAQARSTAEQHFSWSACGAATVRAYEAALT